MECLSWDDYLTPPKQIDLHHARCREAFARQRKNIHTLAKIIRPKNVVCMGSGFLNDIPIDSFIHLGTKIHLVEWMHGITDAALKKEVVSCCDGEPECIVCNAPSCPKNYCEGYIPWDELNHKDNYCANFKYSSTYPHCQNFISGECLRYIEMDVSAGQAEGFANEVRTILYDAKHPRGAFTQATHKAKWRHKKKPLPLKEYSVDFITSSMVVSQFDFEPYSYFETGVIQKFGEERLIHEKSAIIPLAEELRNVLFLQLTEGHCQEMSRILKPGGKIYFSIETMHRKGKSDPWFQVQVAPKAIEMIERYFNFDFDTYPEITMPDRIKLPDGESIVQSYVLVTK